MKAKELDSPLTHCSVTLVIGGCWLRGRTKLFQNAKNSLKEQKMMKNSQENFKINQRTCTNQLKSFFQIYLMVNYPFSEIFS